MSNNDSSTSTTDGRVVFISKALVIRFESPLFFANCRTLSKMLIEELGQRIEADDDVQDNNTNEMDASAAAAADRQRKKKGGRKTTKWKACVIDFGSVGW